MPALSSTLLLRISGNQLDQGTSQRADLWCRVAVFCDPNVSEHWYNLGLVYKRVGHWSAAQQANVAAVQLNPDNLGAWWNLGIAATARGDWETARRAWRAYGIDLPEVDGPPEMNLGYTPIRLQPEGRAEVVWTTRLDPARARIERVPYPSSGRRYGDVILHDGSPNGERLLGGHPVPVFDELALLLTSPYSTFHARVSAALNDRMEDLTAVAAQHGVVAQNWTSSTRMLPRAESEGLPSAYQEPALTGEAEIGIAARTKAEAWAFLQRWTQAQPLREVVDVHLGLAGLDARASL